MGSGGAAEASQRISSRPARERFSRELAEIITEKDIEDALNALRDSLHATKSVRKGRDSTGGPNYTLEPDYTIRICAANLLLQHKHGKPVQRNLMQVEHTGDGETLSREEAIRRLAGSVESLVEIASVYRDSASAIDNAKRVDQVIDADAMPDLPDFSEVPEKQEDAESTPDST